AAAYARGLAVEAGLAAVAWPPAGHRTAPDEVHPLGAAVGRPGPAADRHAVFGRQRQRLRGVRPGAGAVQAASDRTACGDRLQRESVDPGGNRARVGRLRTGGGPAAARGRGREAPPRGPRRHPGPDAGAPHLSRGGEGGRRPRPADVAQRSSSLSLSGLPSHSLASGGAYLRAVITGHSFASSPLSATKCSWPAGTSSSG